MANLAQYKKLCRKLWRDPDFRALDPINRLLCIYLLTGQSNRIGLFYVSDALAMEETGVDPIPYRYGIDTVCSAFGWELDTVSGVLFVPSWWKYNRPENEKAFKGYLKDLLDLPSTYLVRAFMHNEAHLTPAMVGHLIPYRYGIDTVSPQEQEQEQEQKQEKEQEQEQDGSAPDGGDSPLPQGGFPSHCPECGSDYVIVDGRAACERCPWFATAGAVALGFPDLAADIQQDLKSLELPTAGPDVMARWNPLAAAVGLPPIGRWTDKLDGHYRQTIAEIGSAAFWAALEEKLPLLDEFSRGRTDRWKGITFRWLCESRDNFAKFEAGEYDDAKAATQAARGKVAKSGQQKALADMKRWRDGSEADRAKYARRLAMYRTKDSLGKLPAENVWVLEQLGEGLE